VGAVIDPNDGESGDRRIAELARELASAINRGEAGERTELRDLAIDVLKEAVHPEAEAQHAEGAEVRPAATLNPFALGLPLLLAGFFLSFLFPPVGIFLLLLGIVACAFGIALAIGRSAAARWRSRGRGAAE